MAIRWFGQDEAESAFKDTLMNWATAYGYKGCYTAQQTETAILETEEWARFSVTARKLMHLVRRSRKEIIVVGMSGGYQCFDSTAGEEKVPVVFVDLDGRLEIPVRSPHNIHLEPNVLKAQEKGKLVQLDNRVALLHEFGHSLQWIETPSMFDNLPGKDFNPRLDHKSFARSIREGAAALLKNQLCPRCGEAVKKDPKTGHLLHPDAGRGRIGPRALHICRDSRSERTVIPTEDEVLPFEEKNPGGYKRPAWGVKIELDNMSRHEWPICREMGLPLRHNYRDLDAHSDGDPPVTSVLRTQALEKLRREEEERLAKEQREQAIASRAGAVKVCPKCGKTYKGMLQVHKMNPGECIP